jgi:pilus assembly protein FimV
MSPRARLGALLLVLACGQGVFAQDRAAAPATLTVGAGDTATALAQQLRPAGATLEQTLVALWRANPRAFGNGNLNQLLQGATLQVPSEREILRLSAAQAHALVVEQVENFQAFARQQNPNRPAAAASATGLDAAQWARALAEAQALKDALERQSRDTQTRLAQLEKNIQVLQSMQAAQAAQAGQAAQTGQAGQAVQAAPAASGPMPAASAAAEAASEAVPAPEAQASAPEPEASRPASDAAALAASAASEPLPALPQPLLWTGALLALMLVLALGVRRRSRTAAAAGQGALEIPPQMARIDLNLDSPPSGPAGKQDTRP